VYAWPGKSHDTIVTLAEEHVMYINQFLARLEQNGVSDQQLRMSVWAEYTSYYFANRRRFEANPGRNAT
jgi:hypothetical protein